MQQVSGSLVQLQALSGEDSASASASAEELEEALTTLTALHQQTQSRTRAPSPPLSLSSGEEEHEGYAPDSSVSVRGEDTVTGVPRLAALLQDTYGERC